jgi:hypothetical protein
MNTNPDTDKRKNKKTHGGVMRISLYSCLIVFSIAVFCNSSQAQKRYIVNSYGDIIPVPAGKSAADEISKQTRKQVQVAGEEAVCAPHPMFGNLPWEHTSAGTYVNFIHAHKDVIGIWFEAPVSGTLDSVYIQLGDYSGSAYPGFLTMRIHHSNIYTGHAPGWDPYIAPPILCWGYFNNANDADTGGKGFGIAAFPDEATDTMWISTYHLNNLDPYPYRYHYNELVDTTIKSFSPAAEEIWGNGGAKITVYNNAISGVNLADLGKPSVTKGYPFFISFKVPGEHPADVGTNPPFTDPTRLAVYGNGDGPGGLGPYDGNPDPVWRRNFHNWKFYEHPSFCGPGWLARGDDHIFIWYVMTATGDMPPTFLSLDHLGHTLNQTGVRTVQADVEDCNYEGVAGVDTVNLIYNADGGPDLVVSMNHVGGTLYEGNIPNFTCPSTVRYHLEAVDVNDNRTSTGIVTYRTLCRRTSIAFGDTGVIRSYNGSLSSDPASNIIDTSKWFSPSWPGANSARWDDGTAGPFPIGSFLFLGDTMHYAWVGVNGAIALSKTATDTIHVNANGDFTLFELPVRTQLSPHDTLAAYGVPRNFIAPMQANLIVADTTPATYGHVYWKNADSAFAVEWDSVGNFDNTGTIPDEAIFRIVLNKSNGTIEYQYDNIGVNGIDSAAMVGIQADSTDPLEVPGFLLLNYNGDPYELRPRNNWAIKLWLAQPFYVGDGWSTISIYVYPPYGNYSKDFFFPDAGTRAFNFDKGYKVQDSLKPGVGYWMKFTGGQRMGQIGIRLYSLHVALTKGWNMIGSIGAEIPATMSTDPTGRTTGSYYAYDMGYNPTSVIQPGRAYWVKAIDDCILYMEAPHFSTQKELVHDDLTKLNSIILRSGGSEQKLYLGEQSLVQSTAYYELPPAPPSGIFDARFASQQMVETYPSALQPGKEYQYAINFQSTGFPVTVEWNIAAQPEGRTLLLTDGVNGTLVNNPMTGTGSIRVSNASVKSLAIKLAEGIPTLPKAFALGRNYPNPFNSATHVSVEMPVSADVEVSVYDILGCKIATLLSGQQEAGYHTVEWNGTNNAGLSAPSGTYFVRMISGSFTGVQKVLLMK